MPPPVQTAEPPSGARPSRQQIEPAALELIRRRGGEILGTARHYAATPEDAEDAYQRGLEILLTKAPTTEEEQLVPWLKTVVKHEAFALKRQRDRAVTVEDDALDVMADGMPPSDQRAEQYERLRVGAEALEGLKPQERRALLLKAQGYSYNQICEITSWTYTKVNRCLTEGRRRFLERVSGIESGAECERLAPLLSRLADGEASQDDLKVLRPHLRGCLSCSAALRNYRQVPAAVAALASGAPFAVMELMQQGTAAGDGSALSQGADWLVNWVQERAIALSMKAQAVVDAVTAHKTAAIAASTAAIAGGGAATVQSVDDAAPKPREPARAESRPAPRATERVPAPPRPEPERSRETEPPAVQRQEPPPAAPAEPAPRAPVPAPSPPQPARTPRTEPPPESIEGGEFGP